MPARIEKPPKEVPPAEQFESEVFPSELEYLEARWGAICGQSDEQAGDERRLVADRPTTANGLVGVALSGGGIRSATFNLGVIQALGRRGAFDHVDYLSTVSGGGYIGSSLSCLMRDGDKFPFRDYWPLVRYYHEHSNYLGPKGLGSRTAGMLLRGLLHNLLFFLPLLFLIAMGLTRVYPDLAESGLQLRLNLTIWASVAWVLTTPFFALIYWVVRKVRGHNSSVREGLARTLPRLRDFEERTLAFLLVLIFVALLLDFSTLSVPFYESSRALFWGTVALLVVALSVGVALPRARGVALPALGALLLYLPFFSMLRMLAEAHSLSPTDLVPAWLNESLLGVLQAVPFLADVATAPVSATIFLSLAGAIFLVLYLVSDVNLSSMHGFYRDALARSFLLTPVSVDGTAEAKRHRRGSKEDYRPAGDVQLSSINREGSLAPYQLLNTALNLQGNSEDLSRGRSSDFFVLSSRFVGGDRTGYCRTTDMERVHPQLDLAASMAISGAAATANMGRFTNKHLVFPMTMLNIRLGTWAPNPARIGTNPSNGAGPKRWRPRASLIFREMVSAMHERGRSVYLSDGGHLDNTGIFELLRRRCKYIIAGDAEADPKLDFDSLVRLILYARLDLEIDIDIDLDGLYLEEAGRSRKHAALGRIRYPALPGREESEEGWLLYLKASLTGNEDAVVRGYARRHDEFPHESTADQFFDEGQFEAYRRLGYHVADGLFASNLEGYPAVEDWFDALRTGLEP